ncbi:ADP-ribosylation factor-like protein 13A [Spea bombifrons]|uniref:ADP-ribosylation factor-like protein 13A n=1 Tax=Spea bombifrons TaxID=233779 RepID=UPI00234BF92C|nr:ADP-ribosylation factor-like protein 13A [Spea bombifrons]
MERAVSTTGTNSLYTYRKNPSFSRYRAMFHLLSHCWRWVKINQEPIRQVTILFLGLENTGKSSVIRVIQRVPPCRVSSSSSTNPLRTELRLDRFNLTLLELPGGPKTRAYWRLHYSQAHALVFVVDSSDTVHMREVESVLASVLRHPQVAGKPLLILANKQDKPSSLVPSEIIELLSLEPLVNENKTLCRIEPCSAAADFCSEHDWAILKGLRWVLRSVALSYPILSLRVQQDCAEQQDSLHLRVSGRTQDNRVLSYWDVPHDNIKDLVEYKEFPGGKKRPLKPIQNILTQTGNNLRTLKKKKRVRAKEPTMPQIAKNNEDEMDEEDKWAVGQKLSPSGAAQNTHLMGHRTVIQPETQHSNRPTGSRKRKKKRKAILKNQIKSQEIGTSSGDMSNTFDLYRRAMQALKQKQEQQREKTICSNQVNADN